MLILPHLKPSGVMIFHDIHMYKHKDRKYGIGPHHIYENINEKKWASTEHMASIGAVQFNKPINEYESDFLNILNLPWTIDAKLPQAIMDTIFARLSQHYSAEFVAQGQAAFDRANGVAKAA